MKTLALCECAHQRCTAQTRLQKLDDGKQERKNPQERLKSIGQFAV